MGGPGKLPKPITAPPPVDTTKAMLEAYRYAATEKKMRASTGRKGSFLTQGSTFSPDGKNTLLGM